ncbi:MAG TPA: hypothetical protein DCE42_18505, partial [Myxococcales bacterium]|nr:hypothetical protein [Myxococcales bacterium]
MYRWFLYTLSVLLISLCGLGCVKQSSPGVRKAPEKPQQDASTTPVASNKQAPNTTPPPQQRTTKTAQAPDKKTVHKKVAIKPAQRRPSPPDKPVQKAPVLLTFRASSLKPYFSERRYRRLRSALRWNCKKADNILKKKDAFPERLTGAAIFLLARCYQRRRKYDEARKRYALLHKMKYILRDYLYFWEAETWERQRKYDKANALFLKVSKRSRYFRWSRLRVVGNLFKKKKYDELIKVLHRDGYHKRRDATFWLWMARA